MAPSPAHRSPQQRLAALRESLVLASDLADALAVQAARVKQHCRQLEEALEHADLNDLAALEETAIPELEVAAPRREPVGADPARMAAMEMTLAGGTREEVETYLRETLGAANADEILSSLFERPPQR